MCGRFSLHTPVPELAELFNAEPAGEIPRGPRYNLAPTESVVTLRGGMRTGRLRPGRRGGGRELVPLRWGVIPSWAADPASMPLLINARAESLRRRPAFRHLLETRRCAVLADHFYEWRVTGGVKHPYLVRRRDGAPLALAALWDSWRGPDGPLESCAVITTEASPLLAPLHHRMPAALADSRVALWLNATRSVRAERALTPIEDEALEAVPVSRRVNNVRHDDVDCARPIAGPVRDPTDWEAQSALRAPPSRQLSLFEADG